MTKGGDYAPEHVCHPVDMYSLDGKYIQTFDSVSEAADYLGVNKSGITACCIGRYHTCQNYTFRYAGEAFEKYSVESQNNTKVYKFTDEGGFIKEYPSYKQVCEEENISIGLLRGLVKNKKIYKGFIYSTSKNPNVVNYSQRNVTNRPILMSSLDDKPIKLFNQLQDACAFIGGDKSVLIKAASKKRKTAYKHKWEYIENEERLQAVLFLLSKKEVSPNGD